MAISFFSGRRKTVNLVLNDHSIRYAELKQKNPVTPLRYGERLLQPGIIVDGKIQDFDTLANIFDECIDEWKIARRDIRFIVPDSLVIIRKVSIPADVKEDEIHGYLYLELGSTIHLPFEDPVFDTMVLDKGSRKQEVLVFAAPEAYVNEYASLFRSVKLKPVAADVSALANYRLYHQNGLASEDEVLMSIQFDLDFVSMCIFEGPIPVFLRHLPVDGNNNWRLKLSSGGYEFVYDGEITEIAIQFEEIYREIARLMDFYRYSLTRGNREVSRILLNGDHPELDRVVHDLQDRWGIPVHTLKVGAKEGAAEALPRAYHLAIGLGLKEVP